MIIIVSIRQRFLFNYDKAKMIWNKNASMSQVLYMFAAKQIQFGKILPFCYTVVRSES